MAIMYSLQTTSSDDLNLSSSFSSLKGNLLIEERNLTYISETKFSEKDSGYERTLIGNST